VVRLKSSLRTFYGRKHDFVASYGISVTHDHWYVPLVINTIWFSFMTYYRIWNKNTVTRQIPLVGQDILTLPEHPWLTPVFSGVCVSQSKVFCVVFFIIVRPAVIFPFDDILCVLLLWRFLITTLLSSNFSFHYLMSKSCF
jgi:hypothetical protein